MKIILLILGVLAIGIIIYVVIGNSDDTTNDNSNTEAVNETTTTNTATNISATNTTVTPEDTPAGIVEMYIKYTMGTIPGASVDYEKAKDYMTLEYGAGLDNPVFITTTYCMQDGPDAVKIGDTTEFSDGTKRVRVQAEWGGIMADAWDFDLELEGNEWKIINIGCVQ